MKSPLADRVRPQNLKNFVGQVHLVGEGKVIRKALEHDKIFSMVFWGPPGCGKTTLARIIANETESHFVSLPAVTSGVADIRRVVKEAKERELAYKQDTILFIDEIHRFNKNQQDALLPYVEDGTVIFIGATTENPSFEVIGPLLSRSQVFTLNRLEPEELKQIAQRALKDKERGLGKYNIEFEEGALDFLIASANGDSRTVLNTLEIAANLQSENNTPPHSQAPGAYADLPAGKAGLAPGAFSAAGTLKITKNLLENILQRSSLKYDKGGEEHYNTISAFIKSMRGSDPDAALYYMARMLEGGEDPLFIARRMVIFASEDIGNADPHALPLATACFEACEKVGLPECRINMAQTVTYLATASKSNASYNALLKAEKDVKETLNEPIPLHLRNPVTDLMKEKGYGKDYKYPHNFEDHHVRGEDYLPKKLEGKKYYYPTNQGKEKNISKRLKELEDKE
ncbi:MAG: replication-associated recombination protein A [Patescibacteria group bacterium]|nr:replication-associated recombination protein A [Patescibacteria group bacterium]